MITATAALRSLLARVLPPCAGPASSESRSAEPRDVRAGRLGGRAFDLAFPLLAAVSFIGLLSSTRAAIAATDDAIPTTTQGTATTGCVGNTANGGLTVAGGSATGLVTVAGYEGQRATKPARVVKVALNGLEIVLDADTGGILRLLCAGAGTILDTAPETATIVDLACPVPEFEPLRLASRYSTAAKITRTANAVSIHWDRLGASRSFVAIRGNVTATVTLQAAPNGKSVILTCRIENNSDRVVRQVLFPDLLGLTAFAGREHTEFRTGEVVRIPFVAYAKPATDQFYVRNTTFAEFTSTGQESNSAGRFVIFGSAQSGISLFPKRAVWDAGPHVMLHLWERIGKLRMMYNHYVDLLKGAKWESDEYWLTPYQHGFAEAAEPYQAWLKEQPRQQPNQSTATDQSIHE
jgi:hypothetical protein